MPSVFFTTLGKSALCRVPDGMHSANQKTLGIFNVSGSVGKKGTFTVKSVYNAVTSSSTGVYHRKIWKGKILQKIKIFLWLMSNGAILTKDNLVKKKWQGDPSCVFCDQGETISHLFSNALWLG